MLLDFKLSRALETIIGIGLPLLLLLAYELYARSKNLTAVEYLRYTDTKAQRIADALEANPAEAIEIKKQNRYGMQVIAGALVFVALILLILSFLTSSGGLVTRIISMVILLGAIIPWQAAQKIQIEANSHI